MNSAFSVLVGISVAWFSFVLINAYQHDKMVERFEARCEHKGGVTLRGYKHTNEWIGCYKAEEIYNED